MEKLSFDDIAAAIAHPKHKPVGNKLAIASPPEPFVAPVFERAEGETGDLREVVLIRAAAAVGKTTIARALSAACQAPVLDLAKTPVATGTLKGLLSDLRNGSNPVDAFHVGDLPIIVDALDEGRLRSGGNSFDSFLDTTAETILESRTVTNRPKLILLGRSDAIEWAEIALAGAGIEVSKLDVGYFDQVGARSLIHAYAQQAASSDSGYFVHTEPVERLISAYFDKIEAALGLGQGELWSSESGRTFAGYAPVLATLGAMLPRIENFADELIRLDRTGAQDAWSVIESVLDQIIVRDRDDKFAPHVQPSMANTLPAEAYDKEEQLALLLQLVQGEPLAGTGRLTLSSSDMAKYDDGVKRWLPEHPFLMNGDFSNDVIASFVFANAIATDRTISQRDRMRSLSRQPFLWRSLSNRLSPDLLVDGRYLGLLLNSFLSDPITNAPLVSIETAGEGSASVFVRSERKSFSFQLLLPAILQGQLRHAEIDLEEGLILEGAGSDPASSTFQLENVTLRSSSPVTLNAAKLGIAGRVWLDAEIIGTAGQLALEFEANTIHGWGAGSADKYPFNRYPGTMTDPNHVADDSLEELLDECLKRLNSGTPLTLNPDYSSPEGDPHTRWANRKFPVAFPILMRTLVQHGFAQTDSIAASGSGKILVRLHESIQTIREGVLEGDPSFAAFAADLRSKLDR